MRPIFALVLAVAFPLGGQAAELELSNIPVAAYATRNSGFAVQGGDPTGGAFEEGPGQIRMSGTNRIDGTATYGDLGRLEATIDLSPGRFRVELDQVGSPPGTPAGIPVPLGGGVRLAYTVHGYTGNGVGGAVPAMAGFSLVGIGKVYKDSQLISDHALVQAFALVAGTHADDNNHVQLPYARDLDAEIEVWVTGLPTNQAPGGMLRFYFDDVDISIAGQTMPALAYVPSVPQVRPEEAVPTPNLGALAGFNNVPPPVLAQAVSPVVEVPTSVRPINADPASALPPTVRPSNADPGVPLVTAPPTAFAPVAPFPTSPTPANATPSTSTALPAFPSIPIQGLTPSTTSGGTPGTTAGALPPAAPAQPVVTPVVPPADAVGGTSGTLPAIGLPPPVVTPTTPATGTAQ